MYTGGLENWPGLVLRMRRRRPLWGNTEVELCAVRDPRRVHRALHSAGLAAPEVRVHPDRLPGDRRWLRKPLRGARGTGVEFLDPSESQFAERGCSYFQEFIDGEPCAALYVGDGRRCAWLGLTRQLVGMPWLNAGPFCYCGSIGPIEPQEPLRQSLETIGAVLAGSFGLRGLFGVDGVLQDNTFWPVEINPRYTASVEVLEYATGLQALARHRDIFLGSKLEASVNLEPPSSAAISPLGRCIADDGKYVGKAILFARRDVRVRPDGPWCAELLSPAPLAQVPAFADIPAAGEEIAAGRPVVTFFARGSSASDCEVRLRQTAADLDRWLFEQ
jgi:predicted ATP-grasp superfamily ATP-dependent carboligase